MAKAREALRYPPWYWALAGCVAIIGAIELLLGLLIPGIAVLGVTWMIAYFIVATFTHLLRKDFANLAMPLLFLGIMAGLLALRWADVTPMLAAIGL
jgi:hypothetical protein